MLGLFVVCGQLSAQTTPIFTIDPQMTSAQLDQTIQIDLVVSDFEDIVSTQYAVKWDPSIFEFVDVTDVNDTDFATLSSGISTPGGNVPPGQINVLWINPPTTGVTVPDGTLVLTLHLKAIDCGDTDISVADPSNDVSIEVISDAAGFTEVGLTPENGTASVAGTGCGNQTAEVSFDISNATVQGGDNFCLEVSVDDFTDLTDVELSINYNPSMLSLSSVSGLNLSGLTQGSFNTGTAGQITMDWSNATATSVADGTVIFELCFQALLVGSSDVTFSDNPLAISVQDGDGMDVDFKRQRWYRNRQPRSFRRFAGRY